MSGWIKHLELLNERCGYQVDLLKGNADHRKGKRRGRKWWGEEFLPDGTLVLSCRFEVAGKTVVMKGQPCAKCRSREAAIEFYYKIADWCSGELDEVVTEQSRVDTTEEEKDLVDGREGEALPPLFYLSQTS